VIKAWKDGWMIYSTFQDYPQMSFASHNRKVNLRAGDGKLAQYFRISKLRWKETWCLGFSDTFLPRMYTSQSVSGTLSLLCYK